MISTRRHFYFFASFVQSSFGTHAGHVSRRQMSRFLANNFLAAKFLDFARFGISLRPSICKKKRKTKIGRKNVLTERGGDGRRLLERLGSAEGADWPGTGHVTPAAAIIGQVERLRHRLVVTRVTFFGFSKISCCQTSKFH